VERFGEFRTVLDVSFVNSAQGTTIALSVLMWLIASSEELVSSSGGVSLRVGLTDDPVDIALGVRLRSMRPSCGAERIFP